MADKKDIREETQKKRDSVSHALIGSKSQLIKEILFSLPEFKKAKTIMFYLSFKSEVFTHCMVAEAAKIGKLIAIPKILGNTELSCCLFKGFKKLVPNNFGILEHNDCEKVPFDKIDIVIVPGIAFDLKGARIGFGSGYYDRMLSKIKNALFIGLAFESQIVNDIPVMEHDVRMHKVITEKRVIDCVQE